MPESKYSKYELAANQLETAIGLFVGGWDRFSVITLAGAADVILSQLVLNQGKSNFTDHLLSNETDINPDIRTRQQYGREVNNILFINQLKHMDDAEDNLVEFDSDTCAIAAILKAIANIVELGGRELDFVQAFLVWVKLNLDKKKFNISGEPSWEPHT
jgi:hypothetical protein